MNTNTNFHGWIDELKIDFIHDSHLNLMNCKFVKYPSIEAFYFILRNKKNKFTSVNLFLMQRDELIYVEMIYDIFCFTISEFEKLSFYLTEVIDFCEKETSDWHLHGF